MMKIIFEIKRFSQKNEQILISNKTFLHGEYWELVVNPKGNGSPDHISIYLSMSDISSCRFVNGNSVSYDFKLSIIHPVHPSKTFNRLFKNVAFDAQNLSFGHNDFIKLSELNDYLSDDMLRIKCDIFPEAKYMHIKPINPPTIDIDADASMSIEDTIMHTEKHDYYPIQNRSNAKGYVLVISNSQFEGNKFSAIIAHEADVKKIHHLCINHLALDDQDIEIHRNLTSVKILDVLDNLSKKDFTHYDYMMVFLLSHGCSGCIIGIDSKAISYLHLQQYFYPRNCPSLKEKPKCFFLQACRGQFDPSVTTVPASSSLASDPVNLPISVTQKPLNFSAEEADFLFAFACADLSIAWTSTITGSWYITQLCKSIENFSHSQHLLDMLVKTSQLLSTKNKEVDGYGIVSQISLSSHTFTRKLRFFENKPTEVNLPGFAIHPPKVAKNSISSGIKYFSGSARDEENNVNFKCLKIAKQKVANQRP